MEFNQSGDRVNYNDFLREMESTNDYTNYPMGPPSPNLAPMSFLETPLFDSSNFSVLDAIPVNNSQQFMQPKQEQQEAPFSFNNLAPMNSSNSTPTSPMGSDLHPLHDIGDSLSLQQNVETPEGISIVSQPKKYQVVNYNIYPAIEVEFSRQFNEPITIQAFLVYDNNVEIVEGFTNGDVQVLKIGQTRVSFPALHLNRMTPIKNTVQQSGATPGAILLLNSNAEISFSFQIRSS